MTRISAPLLALLLLFRTGSVKDTAAGGALEFTGTSWVRIPHSDDLMPSGTSPWTIEFWISIPYAPEQQHIMAKRSGCESVDWWQLRYDDPNVSVCDDLAVTLPAYDTWVHFAIALDADSMRAYVNGRLAVVDACGPRPPNQASLLFGKSGTCAPGSWFTGRLDEIRMWNVTRGAKEIAESYDREVDPASPGLVGYWKFDEPVGDQRALDSSPFGRHGILGDGIRVDSGDPVRIVSDAPILSSRTRRR